MGIKKVLTVLCPMGSVAIKCVAAHLKLAITITLALIVVVACYLVWHYGLIDPKGEVVEKQTERIGK